MFTGGVGMGGVFGCIALLLYYAFLGTEQFLTIEVSKNRPV